MGAAVPEFTVIEQPTLVIEDIHHHKVEAELLIERKGGRICNVVRLEDNFDDFGGTSERLQCTCR